MIVKIQASIMPRGLVLIYTRRQRILWQGKMPAQIRKFMGKAPKIYAHAHLEGTEIVIDKIAERQDW